MTISAIDCCLSHLGTVLRCVLIHLSSPPQSLHIESSRFQLLASDHFNPLATCTMEVEVSSHHSCQNLNTTPRRIQIVSTYLHPINGRGRSRRGAAAEANSHRVQAVQPFAPSPIVYVTRLQARLLACRTEYVPFHDL